MKPVKWGVISTANIGLEKVLPGMMKSAGIEIVAISSRKPKLAQAAAAKYIDSEQPIIVVVGDAKVVKPQLEKIGKMVVVDNEGKEIE